MEIELLFKSLTFLVNGHTIELNDDGERITCVIQESEGHYDKYLLELSDRKLPILIEKFFKGDELELREYILENISEWIGSPHKILM